MSYEALKAALAAGPTEGPWEWQGSNSGRCKLVAGDGTVILEARGEDGRPADDDLIAACDPATIRALLKDAERYRWLRASKHTMRDTAHFGYVGFHFDCEEAGFDADDPGERAQALDFAIDAAMGEQA